MSFIPHLSNSPTLSAVGKRAPNNPAELKLIKAPLNPWLRANIAPIAGLLTTDILKRFQIMVKTIATYILLMAAMSSTAYGSDSEKYSVSLLVREVKAEWVGDVLFRYVAFSPVSDYPCIRLETLTKGFESRLIDRLDVCEIRINNQMIDLRREDLVGAYLGDFRIGKNVFQFTADVTLGGPGQISHYMACDVAIEDNGKLSKPQCTERPHLERNTE